MKIKILSFYSRILSFFLVLLGFPSCDSDSPVGPVICEYGVPTAQFRVMGNVVDEETEVAVSNIKVVLGQPYSGQNGNKLIYRFDSIQTDKEGKFNMSLIDFPESQKYVAIFEDIDGPENGLYESKTDTVRFDNPTFENGDKRWYAGETEKDMGTIKITPVKTEE